MESPDEQGIGLEDEDSVQVTAQGDEGQVRLCDVVGAESVKLSHPSNHDDILMFPVDRNTLLICGIPVLTADGVSAFL